MLENFWKVNLSSNQSNYPNCCLKCISAVGKYIVPLKEKSAKFPRARWFSQLCEYHCDNLSKCLEHISEPRHQRLYRQKELETTLTNLPRPSRHHLESLNKLLAEIQRDYGLSSDDLKARQDLADSVHSLLEVKKMIIMYYGVIFGKNCHF